MQEESTELKDMSKKQPSTSDKFKIPFDEVEPDDSDPEAIELENQSKSQIDLSKQLEIAQNNVGSFMRYAFSPKKIKHFTEDRCKEFARRILLENSISNTMINYSEQKSYSKLKAGQLCLKAYVRLSAN